MISNLEVRQVSTFLATMWLFTPEVFFVLSGTVWIRDSKMQPLIIPFVDYRNHSWLFTLHFFTDVHVDNKCKLISFSPSSYYVLSAFFGSKMILNGCFLQVEVCVAEWSRPRTPDLEAQGSSLAHCVVSLDKQLYFTLSLFTQLMYKWVPATYMYFWGVTLRWTSIPS